MERGRLQRSVKDRDHADSRWQHSLGQRSACPPNEGLCSEPGCVTKRKAPQGKLIGLSLADLHLLEPRRQVPAA